MARSSFRTFVLWVLPLGLLALGYFVAGPMLIRANQGKASSSSSDSPNANPENEVTAPKPKHTGGPEVSVDASPLATTKPKPKHHRRKAPTPATTPSATPGSTPADEGGSGGAAG